MAVTLHSRTFPRLQLKSHHKLEILTGKSLRHLSEIGIMSVDLRCVIVAVDGSEESMGALRWALQNLKLRPAAPDATDGTFTVLHVQPHPSIAVGLSPGDLEVPAFTAAIESHQRRITAAILEHSTRICSEYKVNVETKVVIGDPKEKICEMAENLHADLLVMGSRTIGPIKRMFLGSVSNYCTNHVECPVIIVKDKQGTAS